MNALIFSMYCQYKLTMCLDYLFLIRSFINYFFCVIFGMPLGSKQGCASLTG